MSIAAVLRKPIAATAPKQIFRERLKQARANYFSYQEALVNKPVMLGFSLIFISPHSLPPYALMAIGLLLEKVKSLRAGKIIQNNEPDLLARMVESSRDVNASFIAKELVSRGGKTLSQNYLTALKETDGTKFNEVVSLMQSNRLRTVSTVKKIGLGLTLWASFLAYTLFLNCLVER